MSDKPQAGRRLLTGLIALVVLVLAVIAAGGIYIATFNANTLKPRIEAAVKRATGRDLALNGPIHLALSLEPIVSAQDVAFANIAGGSQPEMATVQHLQVQVALLPLLSHRVVIRGITLVHPNILLERNAAGTGNWVLGPEAPATPLPQSASSSHGPRTTVAIQSVNIEGGQLVWRSRRGRNVTLQIDQLTATLDSGTSRLHLTADLASHGVKLHLVSDSGDPAALQGPTDQPWPLHMSLTTLGGHVTLDGNLQGNPNRPNVALAFNAAIPDFGALNSIFTHARLPPVRDVVASGKLAIAGPGLPDVTDVVLRTGSGFFPVRAPGLQLSSFALTAPSLFAPAQIALEAGLHGTAFAVTGTAGPAISLLDPHTPLSLDLTAKAAGATLTADGKIAAPSVLSGKDLAIAATIPDLADLAQLADRPLPAVKNITLHAHLGDHPGGLALSALNVTVPQGDLSGAVSIGRDGTRPVVQAALTLNRLDLDALLAAPLTAPPPSTALPTHAGPPSPPPVPKLPPPHPEQARVIADNSLPFGVLRSADADLELFVASLRAGGVDLRSAKAHLVLKGGHLVLDPASADGPGGPVTGRLVVDAASPTPQINLAWHAPALAAQPLLAALHLPHNASGTFFLDADLQGTGSTPHALAASLNGRLGLAMVNGAIDNALIAQIFGDVLRSANIPADLAPGQTTVRCFALRLDANHGVAALRAFALDTSRLQMSGTGAIDLGRETLDLHLDPLLRLGKNGVTVPVQVGGTFLAPKAELARSGPEGRVSLVIGALANLTNNKTQQPDSCGPALTLARNGAPAASPPPVPTAAQAATPASPPKKPQRLDPRQLLRLFEGKGG
jgi:AsmA protein